MTDVTSIPAVSLNDGVEIPQLGFGVFQVPPEDTQTAVEEAFEVGYRHIDTAAAYRNERGVGAAIADSGIPREELFVTTKLWNSQQGYESTLGACEKSLDRLGLDHVDLYLIHWPVPTEGCALDTWRAFERLHEDGRSRTIGVSNFRVEDLEMLEREAATQPTVNQIELHPYFPQEEMLRVHTDLGIQTEAWSPLGKRSAPFAEPPVSEPTERYGVTPAQVILRWHLQRRSLPLPKSATPRRQRQNLDLFGFELTDAEVDAITALARPDGRLFGGDPDNHEEM